MRWFLLSAIFFVGVTGALSACFVLVVIWQGLWSRLRRLGGPGS